MNWKQRLLLSVLIVSLSVSALSVPPVSAASADSPWINGLDYLVDTTALHFAGYHGEASARLEFTEYFNFMQADVILISDVQLSRVRFSNGFGASHAVDGITSFHPDSPDACFYYRVKMDLSALDGLKVLAFAIESVDPAANGFHVQVLQLNFSQDYVEGRGDMWDGELSYNKKSWTMNQSNTSTPAIVPGSAMDSYLLTLSSPAFYKYDYMEWYLYCTAGSIDTITCFFNGGSVPVDVRYLHSLPVASHDMFICIRVDLTGVSSGYQDVPTLFIEGLALPGEPMIFSIMDVRGYVFPDAPDPEVSWLRKIWNDLTAFFSQLMNNLRTWFIGLKDAIVNGFASIGGSIMGGGVSDEVKEEFEDSMDKMDEVGDTLGSLSKPDSGSLDFDSSVGLPAAGGAHFAVVTAPIFNNSFVRTILLFAFMMCIASYVFFGKR